MMFARMKRKEGRSERRLELEQGETRVQFIAWLGPLACEQGLPVTTPIMAPGAM